MYSVNVCLQWRAAWCWFQLSMSHWVAIFISSKICEKYIVPRAPTMRAVRLCGWRLRPLVYSRWSNTFNTMPKVLGSRTNSASESETVWILYGGSKYWTGEVKNTIQNKYKKPFVQVWQNHHWCFIFRISWLSTSTTWRRRMWAAWALQSPNSENRL